MKKPVSAESVIINNDIMRYKKNKLASNLALLGVVFAVLYFLVMYGQQVGNGQIKAVYETGTPVYTALMGASVIINLIVLLMGFYSSEEVKAYNRKFSYVLWGLAVVQIVRIFIYPLTAYNTLITTTNSYLINEGGLVALILFLVLSAGCFIASGVFGFIRSYHLEKYRKAVEQGEIDLQAALDEKAETSTQSEEV
jgi:hypothetical protein